MRKLYKTNYGAASPLEFSIASIALITTLVVVAASMAPPVERGSAQIHADANAKATEIMSLLLTSDSQAGLVVDPETSVPIPPSGSITDITISNSPPIEPYDPDPDIGETGVNRNAVLIWTCSDPDEDPLTYDVYFGITSPPALVSSGQTATSFDPSLAYSTPYYWQIEAKDDHGHSRMGPIWDFTTGSAPSNDPPSVSITYPSEGQNVPSGTVIVTGSASDSDGSVVLVQVWIQDAGPVMIPGENWEDATGTTSWSFNWQASYTGAATISARSQDDDGDYSDPVAVVHVTVISACFLGDTKIAMADGSLKNIQDIKVGELLQSYDTADGEWKSGVVSEVFHHMPEEMTDYYLIINDDLKVTPNHPLYVDGKWVTAGDLEIGDPFGEGVRSIEKVFERVPTYNFEVEPCHTYSVVWGENNTASVVHNKEPGPGLCFLEDTKIGMADGTLKDIEDVEVGDLIKAYDSTTDTIQNDRVTEIYHDSPDQMISDYYLVVNNDLKVTPDHHLYINNEWIQAGDLKIGDQLFKGKVTSLEKIYEKVPSYNLEIEKYHTYLVVFGGNIVIAHNGRTYTHALYGNEEDVSLSRQNSVTENDYTALLSMDKIYELSEIPYQELKEIFSISDEYEFFIKIENSGSIFLNIMPDQSISSGQVEAKCLENIIITDSAGYAYATIAVTVVR